MLAGRCAVDDATFLSGMKARLLSGLIVDFMAYRSFWSRESVGKWLFLIIRQSKLHRLRIPLWSPSPLKRATWKPLKAGKARNFLLVVLCGIHALNARREHRGIFVNIRRMILQLGWQAQASKSGK